MQIVEKNYHMGLSALAFALLKGRGAPLNAVEVAKQLLSAYPRIETILRAAVDSGTTSDPNWAGDLTEYRFISASFVEGLRSISPFDAMLPYSRRLPLRTALAVVTAVSNGTATAEGSIKAISSLTLAAGGIAPQKATAIIIVSDELLRFGVTMALDLLNAELRAGVVAATNQQFLADLAAGISTITSSDNPLTDLRAALEAVSTHGTGKYFWVVSPLIAVHLATYPGAGNEPAFPLMRPDGGVVAGTTVIVSDQLPEDITLVADAGQLALGDEITTARASKEADIVMDTDPTLGSQEVVSMFSTNSVALAAERWFGAQRLRDSAVAVISGADYSVAS